MQNKAKPSTSPIVWLALLLTLGLVYWQWSAIPDAAEDIVVVRSAKKMANTESARIAPKPDSPVYAPVADKSLQDNAAQEIPTQENPVQQAPAKRQLPTNKAVHVLFAAHAWLPPPVKPLPPPPPQAPPLPFSYVGSLKDMPGGDLIILMQQKKILMPKLGAKVDAQWRLDREDGQGVHFTFMPLDKKVVLSKTKAAPRPNVRTDEPENIPTEEMLNQ